MTPNTDQVLRDLPNQFHDAELVKLEMYFAKGEIRLEFRFWVGDLESVDRDSREKRRFGILHLGGVLSALIQPPAHGYAFTDGEGVLVDGGLGAYPGDTEPPDDGLVRLWFFVSTWNARMAFVAKRCDLEWIEG